MKGPLEWREPQEIRKEAGSDQGADSDRVGEDGESEGGHEQEVCNRSGSVPVGHAIEWRNLHQPPGRGQEGVISEPDGPA